MIRHLLQIAFITTLALACMFYPFMPGSHDPLAVTLSMMAQALGFAGLLLVPIGVLWLIYELMKHSQRPDAPSRDYKGRRFALAALVGLLVVGVAVVLAATIASPSLGVAVSMMWAYIMWLTAPALRRENRQSVRIHPAPLYLVVIPGVLVLAQLLFVKSAVESSRRRAILGSVEFIDAIEAYRDVYGRYPPSLASVHHDYDPPVIGVERYHYEPSGDSYNVFFEQFSHRLGTQEFVMYNPRDEHAMIVHNQDILESPQEQVLGERRFHANAARDAGVPHWKYFWFD